MRKYLILSSLVLSLILNSACNKEKTILSEEVRQFILDQYSNMLDEAEDLSKIPRRIDENGALVTTGIYGWTSGFFGGSLWYIYELSGDEKWKEEAIKWTETLDKMDRNP
jgi:NADPH-dependent 7-cyano-7-deazaguanine reductase QueF-like protein